MLTLLWFTVKQTLIQRKIWLTLLLLAGPTALILLIRHFSATTEYQAVWERFHGPVHMLLFMVVVPLVCMLYGTALIGAEVGAGTIVYLLTRRMRRAWVLLAKFLGTALVLVVLLELALLALYLAAIGGVDVSALEQARRAAVWQPGRELLTYMYVAPFAVAAFLAVFVLIGLVTARPLSASVVYVIVFEITIANIPAGIRKYSITHHLRAIAFNSIPGLERLFEIRADDVQVFFPPGPGGALTLCGIIALALALACLLVSTRELAPAKVARE